jgi:hypothetical protein
MPPSASVFAAANELPACRVLQRSKEWAGEASVRHARAKFVELSQESLEENPLGYQKEVRMGRGGNSLETTRGAVANRPIRNCAEKTASTRGEEKQPLRVSAASRNQPARVSTDREKQLVVGMRHLSPTNPLHQIGDDATIPGNTLEVQYMFLRIGINQPL